jgi:hypothetical protein
MALSNMVSSLTARYQRFGDDAALDEAIKVAQQAVELTKEGHMTMPSA